ncbi:MAG: tol-pal system protein YbgF [Desulfovibrio sp.]|jgi:tol-pal system protein YbgF|nr:tol-pal system protein YbgF [Desulfovibrio sp.]
MRPLYLFFPVLLAAGCAASEGDRLAALEENSLRAGRVLDLRIERTEERLDRVEADIAALRRDTGPDRGKRRERPGAGGKGGGAAREASFRATPEISFLLSGVREDLAAAARTSAPERNAASEQSVTPGHSLPGRNGERAADPAREDTRAASSSGGARPPELSEGLSPPSTGKAATSPSPERAGDKAVYEAALALYYRGSYEKASGAFAGFLQNAPQSGLAPNAMYWLGECAYARGQYDSAILTFKDVALKFPSHPKAADALLKTGYAYERIGDMDNARFYWQLLLDDYPASPAARTARRRISGS